MPATPKSECIPPKYDFLLRALEISSHCNGGTTIVVAALHTLFLYRLSDLLPFPRIDTTTHGVTANTCEDRLREYTGVQQKKKKS